MAASITLKGNPVAVAGNELKVGEMAPEFTLQAQDLSDVKLSDSNGQTRILSFVPSLDTAVCDMQTRRFNEEAAKLPGVKILTISVDLPMAQKRWCGAAGVENVLTLSAHRDVAVGADYGLLIQGGPLDRFLARAVFVVDENGIIQHAEYVPEITTAPNFDAALEKAKALAG